MEYRKYEIERAVYRGVEKVIITIPDVVYLTGGSYDTGQLKSKGFLHYIGIVKGDYEDVFSNVEGLCTNVVKFNDKYCFVTLHNISFINDAPEIINPDTLTKKGYHTKLKKWNSQLDLSKYYVALYSEEILLLKMSKIKQIRSEFLIDACTVNARVAGGFDYKAIEQETTTLDSLCLDTPYKNKFGRVVEGEIAKAYWDKLIYDVLKPFDFEYLNEKELNKVDEHIQDIDQAHKIVSDFIHHDKPFHGRYLEDLLSMKTI